MIIPIHKMPPNPQEWLSEEGIDIMIGILPIIIPDRDYMPATINVGNKGGQGIILSEMIMVNNENKRTISSL